MESQRYMLINWYGLCNYQLFESQRYMFKNSTFIVLICFVKNNGSAVFVLSTLTKNS